jgi:hypothetical protein
MLRLQNPFYGTRHPYGYKGSECDRSGAAPRILILKQLRFTAADLARRLKKPTAAAGNFITTMKNFGIIKEVQDASRKAKTFKVSDPKIRQLIQNNVQRID